MLLQFTPENLTQPEGGDGAEFLFSLSVQSGRVSVLVNTPVVAVNEGLSEAVAAVADESGAKIEHLKILNDGVEVAREERLEPTQDIFSRIESLEDKPNPDVAALRSATVEYETSRRPGPNSTISRHPFDPKADFLKKIMQSSSNPQADVDLLRRGLASDARDTREASMNALAFQGKRAAPAVPDLLALLRDSDAMTRGLVASCLKRIGIDSPDVIQALVTDAKRAADSSQNSAAALLALPAGRAAFPILFNDPSARTREAAVIAIHNHDPVKPDEIRQLMPAVRKLVNDPDGSVSRLAAETLSRQSEASKP